MIHGVESSGRDVALQQARHPALPPGVFTGVGPALLFRRLLEPLRLSLHPRWLDERLATLVHGGALLLRYLVVMWVKECHKPPMTGNGNHITYLW